MNKYQYNLSGKHQSMFDGDMRINKASKTLAVLQDFLTDTKGLILLDIGCSSGIMTKEYSKSFKKVFGIDIDEQAVEFAKKIIEKNFGLTESNHTTSGPSKYFECKDINLTVGFISPISNHFCSTCNRLRVTSNGKIFPCLGDNGSEDLVPFLGTDQEIQLKKILSDVIFNKPEKHYFDINKKSYIKERFMNTTGG